MATAIGIDIGGTNLRVARVVDGIVQAQASAPSSGDPETVLVRVLNLVAKLRTADVRALGLGVPGEVDQASRRVLSGGYVDFSGFDVVAKVEAETQLGVRVENDAVMALLGEAAHGAARGQKNVVMMTIGTGIGGAILDQGIVLRGRGSAGQLGHLCADLQGIPCVCGRIGCLETLSSGTAFARHLAEAGLPSHLRAEDLLASDDPRGKAVLLAWAGPLRAAIDSMIAACNPDCVVIGGGAGPGAVLALDLLPPRTSWFSAPILPAQLGADAGVIGAAVAALRGVKDA